MAGLGSFGSTAWRHSGGGLLANKARRAFVFEGNSYAFARQSGAYSRTGPVALARARQFAVNLCHSLRQLPGLRWGISQGRPLRSPGEARFSGRGAGRGRNARSRRGCKIKSKAGPRGAARDDLAALQKAGDRAGGKAIVSPRACSGSSGGRVSSRWRRQHR